MSISLRILVVVTLLAACMPVTQASVEPTLSNQFLISRIKAASVQSAFEGQLARSDPFFNATFEHAVCGNANAQYWAGFDNHHGVALQIDLVAAHMWYSLAAQKGHRQATQARDALAAELPLDQRRHAENRAASWQPLDCSTPRR